jgi:hypothetical protein
MLTTTAVLCGTWLAMQLPEFTESARAMCMMTGPVCPEFDRTPLVFYGEVTTVGAPDADFYSATELRVIEAFKGTSAPRVTIRETTISVEHFFFAVGDRVLVYASGSGQDNKWSTGCSRTRRAAPDDPEVRSLHDLVAGRPGALVFGQLRPPAEIEENYGRSEWQALRAISVHATASGQSPAPTSTDGIGRFELGWLAPGSHSLSVEQSPTYRSRDVTFSVKSDARCLDLGALALSFR